MTQSALDFTFQGATFDEKLDGARLGRQLILVRDLMSDGKWRTLGEIRETLSVPEASASARLRDLRKKACGGFTVDRRRRGEPTNGHFEYRVYQGGNQ